MRPAATGVMQISVVLRDKCSARYCAYQFTTMRNLRLPAKPQCRRAKFVSGRVMSSRQSMPPQRLQPAETARVVFDYLQRGGFPRTAKVFEQEAHSLLRANTSSQKALPAQGLHTILTEYVDFAAKARMRSSFASSFGNARAVRDCLSKLSSVMDDYLATAHCELGPEEQAPR
eukprot:6199642-Pleurochrysis_carterae.AAC.2